MHRFQNLMVGLARTDADAGLIRYAAGVARLGTARELRFVHVLGSSTGNDADSTHGTVLAELQRTVETHSSGITGDVRVSFDILSGPLTDQLLLNAAEKDADVLFLGHGIDEPGRKPLARRLAMKAPCSVWMAPQNSEAVIRRILVPIDFSEHAADSLRVAISLAKLCGQTECIALHVFFDEAVISYEGYDELLGGQVHEAYQRFVAPIDCQGIIVRPLFEEGANVPHVINRVVGREEVGLIAMATRGRSGSSSILLGSITEEMILETRVPLLAVKHFGARLGVLQALLDRRFLQKGDLHTD